MKEAEIVAAIAEKGRNLGLHVMVTSGDRATRRQMSGLPDILAWGNDRFLTLEVKRPDGELRDSQIELLDALNKRMGRCVRHAVVYSVDQGVLWLVWCANIGQKAERIAALDPGRQRALLDFAIDCVNHCILDGSSAGLGNDTIALLCLLYPS